ncbi:MAG: STAS domain-containing protein [Mycobacteriaceae bacterium]
MTNPAAHATRVAPSGATVLMPTGRINLTSAGSLRAQLSDLIAAGNTKVVVDLSTADAIDSSGIGALISSLKAARAAGGDLRLTAPNEQVKSVLKLTNLSRVLLVLPDADAPFDQPAA